MRVTTIAVMETWEYFTTTFKADTDQFPVPLVDGVPRQDYPQHAVQSLIPQLNEFGSQGWEMVSIQLVGENPKKGKMQLASTGFETETYFVTFKRRTTSI